MITAVKQSDDRIQRSEKDLLALRKQVQDLAFASMADKKIPSRSDLSSCYSNSELEIQIDHQNLVLIEIETTETGIFALDGDDKKSLPSVPGTYQLHSSFTGDLNLLSATDPFPPDSHQFLTGLACDTQHQRRTGREEKASAATVGLIQGAFTSARGGADAVAASACIQGKRTRV
jgi:hypothetical protein